MSGFVVASHKMYVKLFKIVFFFFIIVNHIFSIVFHNYIKYFLVQLHQISIIKNNQVYGCNMTKCEKAQRCVNTSSYEKVFITKVPTKLWKHLKLVVCFWHILGGHSNTQFSRFRGISRSCQYQCWLTVTQVFQRKHFVAELCGPLLRLSRRSVFTEFDASVPPDSIYEEYRPRMVVDKPTNPSEGYVRLF